jgi:integrase/recombinase XerD
MKTGVPNLLGAAIRDYFMDHLPRLRGTSPHTIHSYRDSMVLLLRFLSQQRKKPVTGLELTDLDPPGILAFLAHLEQERKNGISTRNVRLSSIHAFFHFVASRNPEHLELAQRVLGIPFKRTRQRAIDYLEYDEIDAILKAIDRSTLQGSRDYALLSTMFNTGGRVQEIADLRACDLQLTKPLQVRLFGKECHSYCISLRPRHETTGTHACRPACNLAFSLADVLLAVRKGTGLGPCTDAHGARRVEPMSEPYPA